MKKLSIALVAAAAALVAGQAAAAEFSVYCANGKIEVDSRNLQQMKSARSNVYQIAKYKFLTDAQNHAKKLGGVGKSCPRK